MSSPNRSTTRVMFFSQIKPTVTFSLSICYKFIALWQNFFPLGPGLDWISPHKSNNMHSIITFTAIYNVRLRTLWFQCGIHLCFKIIWIYCHCVLLYIYHSLCTFIVTTYIVNNKPLYYVQKQNLARQIYYIGRSIKLKITNFETFFSPYHKHSDCTAAVLQICW